MAELCLYEVDAEYTHSLYEFDDKVPQEHEQTGQRKFVGVVFSVNEYQYFAPMSSPKPKHMRLSSSMLDLHKLDGGKLGVINLNNMIPVPLSCLRKVDVNAIQDEKYRLLLVKQLRELKKDAADIVKKAHKLYRIVVNGHSTKLQDRCCNFALLESKARDF